jgi:hypothetical protein
MAHVLPASLVPCPVRHASSGARAALAYGDNAEGAEKTEDAERPVAASPLDRTANNRSAISLLRDLRLLRVLRVIA